MRTTYDASDRFFRDRGRVLRLNNSLGLLTVDIRTCYVQTHFSSHERAYKSDCSPGLL